MPIIVKCECGKTLKIKDHLAGKQITCPVCQRELPIFLKCGKCGKTLKIKDHLAGKRFRCPVCGQLQVAPKARPRPPVSPPKPPKPEPSVQTPPKRAAAPTATPKPTPTPAPKAAPKPTPTPAPKAAPKPTASVKAPPRPAAATTPPTPAPTRAAAPRPTPARATAPTPAAPAPPPPRPSVQTETARANPKGERRRMYLFERAYVDYLERARTFCFGLTDRCGAIWHWFWGGDGSKVMEIVLRICVVLSGIWGGVLFLSYERSHGRGFSAGAVAAFLLIAAYIAILAWGWKTPVQIGARGAAAACAAGTVLLIGGLAVIGASLAFSVYLLVLFVLTASSFLVFLPVRGYHRYTLWRQGLVPLAPWKSDWRYLCPHGCTSAQSRRLPLHECPQCGAQYENLRPSFYGIFHHKCWHEDGTVTKLPTLDPLGRSKLQRYCPECKKALAFSSIGSVIPCPIMMVGGTAVGKTILLRQVVREMSRSLGGRPESEVRLDSKENQKRFESDWRLLDSAQLLRKTAVAESATGVLMRVPDFGLNHLLYLYDAPGENFETMREFAQKQMVRTLRAILLLVDPSSLDKLSRHIQQFHTVAVAEKVSIGTIAGNLVEVLGSMQVDRNKTTGLFDIPLAVVLSKADAFPTDDYPFLTDLYGEDGRVHDAEALNTRCKNALVQLGGGNAVNILELNFSTVRYFACSALGRPPDASDTRPFRPAAVIEPFTWMLERELERLGRPTGVEQLI